MLDWLKSRFLMAGNHAKPEVEPPKPHRSAMSGKYLSLYTYLDNRFANNVVLTFGQIEDLLGFALPEGARLQQAWWTSDGGSAAGPRYSDAWTLTSRTAKPNLRAETVAFERAP